MEEMAAGKAVAMVAAATEVVARVVVEAATGAVARVVVMEVAEMVAAAMVVVMVVEMVAEMAAAAREAVVRETDRAGAAMVEAAKENRQASKRESRQGSGSASVVEAPFPCWSQLSSRPWSRNFLAAAARCLPQLTRSRMQTAHVLLAWSDSAARRASMCWTDSRLQTGQPTTGRARADPSSSRTDCK